MTPKPKAKAPRSAIGARVRELRLERRWTQAKLAKLLGISQNYLSVLERGQGFFTAEQFLVILSSFDVSVDYFSPGKPKAAARIATAPARPDIFAENCSSCAEIEATVSNLIAVLGLPRHAGTRADFLVEAKHGLVAIEVKSNNPDNASLSKLERLAGQLPRNLGAFLIVSPDAVAKNYAPIAAEISRRHKINAQAVGLKDLAGRLGAPRPFDLNSAADKARLQDLAITANFKKYSAAHVGLMAGGASAGALPAPLVSLSRQFPIKMLWEIYRQDPNLNEILKIDSHAAGAIIVLSDIKNFSKLVKAVRPVDVQEAMARYYRSARELIRKHNGVLDKFIGDAVLAIFNYPLARPTSAEAAVRFGKELIFRGRDILADLSRTFNDVIETGTRVGIASGDLSVLDIGESDRQIAFVGDSINLAARLEQESMVDEILIDHRTKEMLAAANENFAGSLGLKERTLESVKGQINRIRCWQTVPGVKSSPRLVNADRLS